MDACSGPSRRAAKSRARASPLSCVFNREGNGSTPGTGHTGQAHAASRRPRSNAELLAREAIERLVEHDEWFIREVNKGIAAADRGELFSHEEVERRLKTLVTKKHFRA